MELGSYLMLPIFKLFGTNFDSIRFETIDDENGLDIFTKVSFSFSSGLATATCGLGVKSEGRLLISGTEGYIVVAPPWWKTTYFELHFEDPNRVERHSEPFLDDGLRYELSDMVAQINCTDTVDFKLSVKESVAMAEVIEKFLATSR